MFGPFGETLTQYRVGLRAVYPKGVKGDYKHLEKAKRICFLSISLRSLHEVDEHIITAISTNDAIVKILILDPDSSFVREREKQEGADRAGRIKEECESTIRMTREVIDRLTQRDVRAGSIELRTYDTMPYCSCVITDKQIRYTPYLMHLRAGSSMMLRLASNGPIPKNLTDHFNAIWNNGKEKVKKVWT